MAPPTPVTNVLDVAGPGKPPPQRLGDFELREVIGAGGMGTVYKALQLSLLREVAVKVLQPHLSSSPGLLQRFRREAHAVGQLSHDHIVRGITAGFEHGWHYIAMELIDGVGADHFVRDGGRLSVGNGVRIGIDVARALACAHAKNIVHRDLKPSNVLIGRDGAVKLTDLGIAKLLADDEGLTKVGGQLGTPSYMAPEQEENPAKTDPRSDVFSLGVTLYHLLAGRRPFPQDAEERTQARREGRFPRLRKVNRAVPAKLDRIITRMLTPSPAQRFSSAEEVAAALEHTGLANAKFLWPSGEEDDPACGWRERVRRHVQAHGRAAASMAVVALSLAAGAWFLATQQGGGASGGRVDELPEPTPALAAVLDRSGDDAPIVEGILAARPDAVQRQSLLTELDAGAVLLLQYQTAQPRFTSEPVALGKDVTPSLTPADNYRLGVRVGRECIVHVLQIDASNEVSLLMPSAEWTPGSDNPLRPDVIHWIPTPADLDRRRWLHLAGEPGDELLVLAAADRPIVDVAELERRLQADPSGTRERLRAEDSGLLWLDGEPEGCFADGRGMRTYSLLHRPG